MLIRSQDKKLLINFNNIESVSICGYKVENKRVYENEEDATAWYISCVFQDYSPFIGNYSTEEKAMKVLDMIQNKYLEYYHLKGGPAILKGTIDVAENMWEVPKVFQMPQESEVE